MANAANKKKKKKREKRAGGSRPMLTWRRPSKPPAHIGRQGQLMTMLDSTSNQQLVTKAGVPHRTGPSLADTREACNHHSLKRRNSFFIIILRPHHHHHHFCCCCYCYCHTVSFTSAKQYSVPHIY
uniref:Uncharacterized protein n=1 Tax=Trypanosoma vivax (strain Y486) TaxID=1055687 RepID=G0TZ12_TRYVY|nr:hypothetical protein, unlikely [Trypanosoma vivax Y486]